MLLYIHIPFCESKCPYCAFGSLVGKENLAKSYFEALIDDLKAQICKFDVKKNSITSVFVGGGTPSVIDANLYENLFFEIYPFFASDAEITSEANPNSANLVWLKKMMGFGVNRISFGAQSFFADKLKFLGRTHSSFDVYEAVKNAKKAGFKNINVDLIYGTKFDTKKRLEIEIENIKNLEISHLSAYSLTLEEKTPFQGKISYKKDSPILAKFLINQIEKIGLKQYEISNFGQICRHNLGYWQGQNYLAIGAYAVGFMNEFRFRNSDNLNAYIKNPHEKNIENLSLKERNLEHIFLGARSIVGIEASRLSKEQVARAEILHKNKKLNFKDGRYFVTNFLLADEISLFIVS
ncbi:radical SAM family heme chaperone HemW [Campylobacter sp. RM16192]|uniref:radical SAM family heme chaperone HemW n=1 Tax=Campylobacter sp. RM16192 TaxID=1660080 RepID=UPI00145249E5|nr:radical SAM family heme chaperone HemW [Campylobacter sp. RM16192]QCD52892.1 oxygen-independent coproporphyrinogen III oxidase [Campylobacter sp. RM16192]